MIPNAMYVVQFIAFCVTYSLAFVTLSNNRKSSTHSAAGGPWKLEDDWFKLSEELNSIDSSDLFNIDPVIQAARSFEHGIGVTSEVHNDEDSFVSDVVDTIQGTIIDRSSPNLYDTDIEIGVSNIENFLDKMGREIALLVRCNESPNNLLVSMGKALPELSHEDMYDLSQLIQKGNKGNHAFNGYVPTEFFSYAIKALFSEHATDERALAPIGTDLSHEYILDRNGVASWFSKSTGQPTGPYERQVTEMISKYGDYGTGSIKEDQFFRLYMEAATTRPQRSYHTRYNLKDEPTVKSNIEIIWRDIENHGLKPPIVEERNKMKEKLEVVLKNIGSSDINFVDECEILEWKDDMHSSPRRNSNSIAPGANAEMRKSSHELVELASDNKTPKRIRDSDFTFVDEESCIGCTLCASISPSTFKMLDSGRARTFHQDNFPEINIAVEVCPVSAIHKVSYQELRELEIARDLVREDRKHLEQQAHIPIHVARRESDVNRRTSVYHSLKQDCSKKSCPQRGCYDCPVYSKLGGNPFFQEKHLLAESIRAADFIASGDADKFRKTEEM